MKNGIRNDIQRYRNCKCGGTSGAHGGYRHGRKGGTPDAERKRLKRAAERKQKNSQEQAS